MRIMDLVALYLGDNECDDFADWAFGPSFSHYQRASDLIAAWNHRHYDEYSVFHHGKISDDLPEMVKIWKEKKNKKLE